MKRVVVRLVLLIGAALGGTAIAGPLEDATAAYVRGDYATALPVFRSLADQGNPAAQVNLGYMYANGRGVVKDDAEAVEWFRKAAEQGDASGQNELGRMYRDGRGVTRDDAVAAAWFRKAAEQGNANAETNLGAMYESGRGVDKDDGQAVQWYRRAAEQGNAYGQNALGFMYDKGWGVAQDDAQALQWYRKAAEQGAASGENNLGRLYRDGRGVTRDDAVAVGWFRKAAEQGDANGKINLGYMYETGRGVPKNETEAVNWYRRAAEQGNAYGQNNLGNMYKTGRGVAKDATEAVNWYRKAAEQGNPAAQTNLGAMYRDGRGVTRDDAAAVAWFRKAAEQGLADAQVNLGFMYDQGRGVWGRNEALQWYRKASEQGDPRAQNSLGMKYRDGSGVTQDDTEAVSWFRKAAEQGDANGKLNLGYMYETGHGVAKDETEAVNWYRKAAEQGNAAAQTNLGIMYRDGRGVAQDRDQAMQWLRKASEQGNAGAKTILTSIEEQGRQHADSSPAVAPVATSSMAQRCAPPAASAYVPAFTILRDDMSFDVRADGAYTYEQLLSICLNNDQGVKQSSQFPLSYSGSLQDLEVLEAYTTTKDGKRVDVEVDKIMLQQSPASAGAPMFSDAKVKTVVFPATEIGAVVTLRQRRIQEAPQFPGNYSMVEVFPRTTDIRAAHVTLRAPESLKVSIEAVDLAGGEVASELPGTKLWRWTIQNATAHVPELGSANAFDFSPRVVATTFAGYDAAGKAYLDRARPKAAVTPATQKLADEITKGIADQRAQAEALYQWVSKNIRYVAIILGSGGVVPHDAEAVVQAKYGDCKDHVTVLEALLAAKGIKSSPVLVNLGDTYSLPKVASLPGVFNHVITYLPEFDLFVDSTSGIAPFGVLPAELRGKPALVSDDGKGVSKVVSLPLSDVKHDSVRVDTQLSVGADGTITGSSKIVNAGYFDLFSRKIAMSLPKGTESQLASTLLTMTGQNGTGTYIFDDPQGLSSAFAYSTRFVLPNHFQLPGPGALSVPVGLGLAAISRTFDLMDLPQRDFPMVMLSGHHEELTVLTLPESIKISVLPKPAAVDSTVGHYESSYTQKGNMLTIKRVLDVNLVTPTIGADDYQKLRAMGDVVKRDVRAQIVYQ